MWIPQFRTSCRMSHKSITDYVINLGSSLVSWKSKNQHTVTRSSVEAEQPLMASVACEIIWLCGVLTYIECDIAGLFWSFYNISLCLADSHLGSRLFVELEEENFEVLEYDFPTRFLSPVRDQKMMYVCGHISTLASVEMLFRQCGMTIDGSESYYFDVQDLVENVYMACSDPTELEFLKKDTSCDRGIRFSYILSFIIRYGLKSIPACTDPSHRSGLTHFDEKDKRHKINSFKRLPSTDVMWYARHRLIIAVLRPYDSFKDLKMAIYRGPTLEEKATKSSFNCLHAVLIVGCLKVKKHNTVENYVVVQNSYGTTFGLLGFAVIPFDCVYLNTVSSPLLSSIYFTEI